jgi:hypothetical protein
MTDEMDTIMGSDTHVCREFPAIHVQKGVSLVHRREVEEPVNLLFPLGQVVATPAALKVVPLELLTLQLALVQ